jgi:sodium-coupled monocarboxylate transporter 8/12
MVDFYERLFKGAQLRSEQGRVKLARILTVFYGLLVMLIAFEAHRFGSLVESTNVIIGLMGGPLLGMFILGMFSRRANAKGVIAGWVAGVAVGMYVCFETSISFLWYTLCGFFATVAVGWLASLIFPRPTEQKLQSLIWSSRYEEQKVSSDPTPIEPVRAE